MDDRRDELTEFRVTQLEKSIKNQDVRFDKLIQLQQEQSQTLVELKIILQSNTHVLEEHQRRSVASESRLDRLEKSEQKHYGFIKGSIWIISITWAVIISIASLYVKLR